MNRLLALSQAALCVALLSSTSAISQDSSAGEPSKSVPSSRVAHVYVTRPTHIDGFAVSANGKLTPVPGSPFKTAQLAPASIAVNKNFLFVAEELSPIVYSYAIASNGSLKLAATTNLLDYTKYNTCGDSLVFPLRIDGSGSTLYTALSTCDGSVQTFDEFYQSFKIGKEGNLEYIGSSTPAEYAGGRLELLGTDEYGYVLNCPDPSQGTIYSSTYKRESDGLLTYVESNAIPVPPSVQSAGITYFYCPDGPLAADPANHMAVAMDLESPDDGLEEIAIANYTANSRGALTTKSTLENMPLAQQNLDVYVTSIAPTGKLLAVGGTGFQLFHFNGANPVTAYSALLQSNDLIGGFAWDQSNHLFATGMNGVYVYTVTPATIVQAPGSPYSIPEVGTVIVQPE